MWYSSFTCGRIATFAPTTEFPDPSRSQEHGRCKPFPEGRGFLRFKMKGVNPVVRTHGESKTHAYKAWNQMLARVRNPNNNRFQSYGARGINFDPRWEKYENFIADMGPRPKGMTLDRIDNNGNYCKENCRWASLIEQGRNRSTNRLLTHNGVTLCATAWAERAGIPYKTFHYRIQRGWSVEKAITTPVMFQKEVSA